MNKPPILDGNKATVLSAIRNTAILRSRRCSHQATLGKHSLFTLMRILSQGYRTTMLMKGLTLPET